jgi:hypothetical protein
VQPANYRQVGIPVLDRQGVRYPIGRSYTAPAILSAVARRGTTFVLGFDEAMTDDDGG